MRCVSVINSPTASGHAIVGDGGAVISAVIVPDSADSGGKCANGVVLSQAEYSSLANSPLNVSVEDGLLISSSILTLWAIAWAIRATRKALD